MEADRSALGELVAAARETVARGPLCAAQVAVAQHGRLVGSAAFGRATFAGEIRDAGEDSLFTIYSCTKAVTAAAAWVLLQEGSIRLDDRVADHVPEFAANGKDTVTIEHLLTHTAGLPGADNDTLEWLDRDRLIERFASWELEWEPGSRFVYHSTSGMWVLAEVMTRAAGVDWREIVRTRITEPLGLVDLHVGVPESELRRVADVVRVGEPMTEEERAIAPVDAPVVDEDDVAFANSNTKRMIGSPSGGCITTAADLAMFYQGLLADARGEGTGTWEPTMLRTAWTARYPGQIDPMTGHRACRGLGVVVADGDDRMWRGFPPECSARAFGHMGAAGQVGWADPASGLSFAYVTNGADRNPTRQGATGFFLSSLAAACAAPDR